MSRFRSLFAPLPLLQRNEERWFWLFIAPFLAGFVLFALLPLIASLALSFMDWNLRGTPKLVGLENYADLVNLEGKGKLVLKAFSNTAMITIIAVPLQLAIGMAFAMLLTQKVRGMEIYRMAFYLPTVVAGVATAALYPSVTLLGSVSLGATRFSNLGNSGSVGYSVGPLISWNFPLNGAARARVAQSKAVAEGSLARFDAAVLAALKETDSAIARAGGAIMRESALRRAMTASSDAARLARIRFDNGADSFLQLLDAERQRAQTRAALAAAEAARADAQISVFKALGGGWQTAPPAP